jgi:hypothetical protein
MKRIDENLKDTVKFGASDKAEWLKNHTMSVEERQKLIEDKMQRVLKQIEFNKKFFSK